MSIRFIFALHNHQPVGNFEGVFEGAYRDSYAPFLELLDQYPDIPFCLHTSGCLMEWLAERKPDYIDRLRRMVARGQVEILGGVFYEPIMTMIPPRDRVGQIRSYTAFLEDLLATRVRGMWIPERVWEQNLVSDIAEAGIEYTVLDDYHFKQGGVDAERLFGHYVSEDNGRLLRVFPISERLRYVVPFQEPEASLRYFQEVAAQHPDAVVVFADDGEKFGSWPGTHQHCFTHGWLRRFLEMLRHHQDWITTCHFGQTLDETPSIGKVYLPDGSYREMTEWALPERRLLAYNRLVHSFEHDERGPLLRQFLRGGYWRNFKVKYPETEEMYARMMEISQRLHAAEQVGADPNKLAKARTALYRGQCNCPWWHGAFGGLYLPHLRNAVYQHLIAADNALREINHRDGDWTDRQIADFNFDGQPEVKLSNSRLSAYFRPNQGGCLYELDLHVIRHNLLATLSRRPEAYHDTIARAARGEAPSEGSTNRHDPVIFKQGGLEQLLHYDPYSRKGLIDHFYDPKTTLTQLTNVAEKELGDFVTGHYDHAVSQHGPATQLVLSREGKVGEHRLHLTKEITLRPAADQIEIRYVLDNLLPGRAPFLFAVEFNFAGMAAGADDRYFQHEGRPRAGQLQTLQDLTQTKGIALVDEWLGLNASLTLSQPGGIWAFPIQTVSNSESGFELVHQSTAVVPHWRIEADSQGRWEVTLGLRLDVSQADVTRALRVTA
ncbi:MAG: alpha-amylase/4-alpha-glucanotransferase domain-containing protein [Gemmataceae bacterium]